MWYFIFFYRFESFSLITEIFIVYEYIPVIGDSLVHTRCLLSFHQYHVFIGTLSDVNVLNHLLCLQQADVNVRTIYETIEFRFYFLEIKLLRTKAMIFFAGTDSGDL